MTVEDKVYTVSVGQDLLTVAVSAGGEYHIQATNNELKRQLKYFLKFKEQLPLVSNMPHVVFEADVNDPVGLTAAMLNVSSQSLLLEAPTIVWETMNKIKP